MASTLVAMASWLGDVQVQATLRQLSTKLSTSMLLLGSSCGASLLLLVQLTVFEQEEGLKAMVTQTCRSKAPCRSSSQLDFTPFTH